MIDAPLSFLAPIAIEEVVEEATEDECAQFTEPPSGETISSLAARCALNRARTLHHEGDVTEALRYLTALIEALPEIADRFQITRGTWALEMGDHTVASEAFAAAARSSDSTVRLLGKVGQIRALAHTNPARATRDLNQLVRRLPRLPQQRDIELGIAERYEALNQVRRAIAGYRAIDREAPGSAAATQARAHLARLREAGQAVGGYSAEQLVTRAERWMRTGPLEAARGSIEAIHSGGVRLSTDQRARIALLRARIARIEGRFGEASSLLNAGRNSSRLDAEQAQRVRDRARDMAEAATPPNTARAQAQIRRVQRGRPYIALRPPQLLRILDIAVREGLSAEANRVLRVLPQKRVSANTLFASAIRALGVADEEQVLGLLNRTAQSGRLDARYHYARLLEERGETANAAQRYRSIVSADRSAERYYAMWASLRLDTIEAAAHPSTPAVADEPASHPLETPVEEPALELSTNIMNMSADDPSAGPAPTPVVEGQTTEAASPHATSAPETPHEGRQAYDDDAPMPELPAPDTDALAQELAPVAEAHGEAYPHLRRAQRLLELGEARAAADELTECMVAWREARGRPLRRIGLEAVSRGTERSRRTLDRDVRLSRRELDEASRATIAAVSLRLGEAGTYVALTGWHAADERPRAHEDIVVRAAQSHGLDPNLLFAVMRVESVFQSRIVSYAGAVGLMQIMPRTGQNIAGQLGCEDFTTAQLLDPETNITFAAWYLASLIDRFDGRLPLAIAAYNGGPHNVRRWVADHSPDMPLDAFLERIPFNQTHRYVRRVLTHYQAYREQQGLPMIALSTALPHLQTDRLAF